MDLQSLVVQLSAEKVVIGQNGKGYSSFLKSLSSSQLDYFANNLNESVFNIEEREHQELIAFSCLVSAPLVLGGKGDFRHRLTDNHCDYNRNLQTYLRRTKNRYCLDAKTEEIEERISVLRNLAKTARIRMTNNIQNKQTRSISSYGEGNLQIIYATIIAPMFGYRL